MSFWQMRHLHRSECYLDIEREGRQSDRSISFRFVFRSMTIFNPMSHTRKYGARARPFFTFVQTFMCSKLWEKGQTPNALYFARAAIFFLLSLSCNRHDVNPPILHKTNARVGRRLDWVVWQKSPTSANMLKVISHTALTRFDTV